MAWKPGPSTPGTSHPKPRFPATLADMWRGSQVHRPPHLPPEVSFPRHASANGVSKPGPSGPVTPVNSSTPRAACLNAPGSRPGYHTSLRQPDCCRCRQLLPLTTRLPKNLFHQQMFATSRRSARGRTAPTPLALTQVKFYAFDVSRVRLKLRQKQLS